MDETFQKENIHILLYQFYLSCHIEMANETNTVMHTILNKRRQWLKLEQVWPFVAFVAETPVHGAEIDIVVVSCYMEMVQASDRQDW
jgi:hypothetical protein